MIGHHNPFIERNMRKTLWQSQPLARQHFSGLVERHFRILNFTEQAQAFFGANGYEINSDLRIIVAAPTQRATIWLKRIGRHNLKCNGASNALHLVRAPTRDASIDCVGRRNQRSRSEKLFPQFDCRGIPCGCPHDSRSGLCLIEKIRLAGFEPTTKGL